MKDEHGEVINTNRFLADMDQDQLQYCVERARELIEQKRNEAKRTIWQVVEDSSLVMDVFREDEYVEAIESLAARAKKAFGAGETNCYSLEKMRIPASEYDSYMDSFH